jgi:hypothetical protein
MTTKNPKVHSLQSAPKPPTEEEKKTQQARFIMQQRGAIAQGALNSLLSNPSLDMKESTPDDLVDYALACADAYIERVYGFILKAPKEDAE